MAAMPPLHELCNHRTAEARLGALEVCYHKVAYQCQSKTLSSQDFESTYTNKVPFGALAVC